MQPRPPSICSVHSAKTRLPHRSIRATLPFEINLKSILNPSTPFFQPPPQSSPNPPSSLLIRPFKAGCSSQTMRMILLTPLIPRPTPRAPFKPALQTPLPSNYSAAGAAHPFGADLPGRNIPKKKNHPLPPPPFPPSLSLNHSCSFDVLIHHEIHHILHPPLLISRNQVIVILHRAIQRIDSLVIRMSYHHVT